MTSDSRGAIRLTHAFTASAERVFDVWLSPDKAARWLVAGAVEQVSRVEIDARVGGSIRFVARRAGRSVEYSGEYLEIRRPHRLCFTIRDSASANTVRVTVRIEPRNAGCFMSLMSEIEPTPLRAPASLQALASSGALETYQAEKVVRPRWPTLQAKAALSLGLHLAMLPLLPIVLREPELPLGAGSRPTLAMMTVDIGVAEGAKLPAVVAPGKPPAISPPVPPIPAQQPPVAARPAPHATTSRNMLGLPASRITRAPSPAAENQAASADSRGAQAAGAPGAFAHSTNGQNPTTSTGGAAGEDSEVGRHLRRMAGAEAAPPLVGTICSGTISFAPGGGVVPARGGTGGRTFYGGQKVPVEADFFRDRDGMPWVRFTLWPEASWNLPVSIAGNEVRWTDVDGSGYTLRPAANGHLTGLAGFLNDSAAKIDFTCAGSDAHPT
jgi:uncharacterized protein YndB with AHSA1/START domain